MNKKQWIRTLPCAICSAPPPSEASHVTTAANRGIGIKPSDNFLIPACRDCHALEHQHGRAEVLRRKLGVEADRNEAKEFYLELASRYDYHWQNRF